jgi:hypothetical protein
MLFASALAQAAPARRCGLMLAHDVDKDRPLWRFQRGLAWDA